MEGRRGGGGNKIKEDRDNVDCSELNRDESLVALATMLG